MQHCKIISWHLSTLNVIRKSMQVWSDMNLPSPTMLVDRANQDCSGCSFLSSNTCGLREERSWELQVRSGGSWETVFSIGAGALLIVMRIFLFTLNKSPSSSESLCEMVITYLNLWNSAKFFLLRLCQCQIRYPKWQTFWLTPRLIFTPRHDKFSCFY